MATLNRQQVEQIVNSRPEGMSPEDAIKDILSRGYQIEGLSGSQSAQPNIAPLDAIISPTKTANSTPSVRTENNIIDMASKAPGTLASAMARPFAKSAATVALAGEKAFNTITKGSDEANRLRDERLKSGGFDLNPLIKGKTQPIGAESYMGYRRGEMGGGEATGRMAADFVGTQAEMASYALAPLKIAGKGFMGFLSLLKGTAGVSSAVAVGAAGQSLGEGDSLGEAALRGTGGYIASTATFGLMRFAGNLFRNRGAVLIQDDALRKSSDDLNTLMTDMVKANPELLDPAYASNVKAQGSVLIGSRGEVFVKRFNDKMEEIRNLAINRLLPNVDNPAITTHNVYLGIADAQGAQFKGVLGSDELYDLVRNQTSRSRFDELTTTQKAIQKAKDGFGSGELNIPTDERAAAAYFDQLSRERRLGLDDFLAMFEREAKDGIGIPQALRIMEESYQYMGGSNAERAAIRGIIGAMRDDLRKTLPVEDVKAWDLAHNKWQQATTLYEDSVLTKIKDSGFGDDIVNGLMSSEPGPSRDLLFKSLNDPETKQATQELLLNTVLRRAKERTNAEANIYLKNFKEAVFNRDTRESFLNAEQLAVLDDFIDFTSQRFDQTLYDMQNALQITPQQYREFVSDFGKVGVFKQLTKGSPDDIDAFANNFNTMLKNEPEKIGRVIGQFDDKERELLGSMFLKDLLSQRNVAVIPDPKRPGTMMMSDSYMKTYEEMYQTILNTKLRTGSDDLYGMFSADELAALENGYTTLNDIRVLSTPQQQEMARQTVDAVTALLYAKMGYVTGAARYARRAASEGTVANMATKQDIQETALKYIQEGRADGSLPVNADTPTMIDYLNARFATPAAGNLTGNNE